jgi:hypothetical protein
MGLRLSTRQLRIVTELVLTEIKREQNIELDELLDRLAEMAKHRGLTYTMQSQKKDPNDLHGLSLLVARERPDRKGSPTPIHPKRMARKPVLVEHPLFRDEQERGKKSA